MCVSRRQSIEILFEETLLHPIDLGSPLFSRKPELVVLSPKGLRETPPLSARILRRHRRRCDIPRMLPTSERTLNWSLPARVEIRAALLSTYPLFQSRNSSRDPTRRFISTPHSSRLDTNRNKTKKYMPEEKAKKLQKGKSVNKKKSKKLQKRKM